MRRIAIPMTDLKPSHSAIADELDEAWHDVVATGAFTLGSKVAHFERQWADYCGASTAVGVGSGTEAIEFALRAIGVGPGDEVIVPAMTFIATAAAVTATGATPAFCDVDAATLLLTPERVAECRSARTRAVIVVHLYGNPVDVAAVREAMGDDVAIIEDASQAHGATVRGRRVGSLGDLAAFSHYPTKNLGAFGDAGTVTTDRDDLARRIRLLGNHGRPDQAAPEYEIVGRTGRLDALQAAVLSTKLAHLDGWNAQRREIVAWYDELLPAWADRMAVTDPDLVSAPHLCVVGVDDRDRIRGELAAAGIGTGIHYPDPVPRTMAYGRRTGEFPVAEAAADRIISLPLWPGMNRDHVEATCKALTDCS